MQNVFHSAAGTQGLEFLPPAPPGFLRAVVLALLAHLVLVVALTFGVSWRHSAEPVSFDAELWSQLPQQAAPKPVEAEPPLPVANPKPIAKAFEPPPVLNPNIVTEREKKRAAEEKLAQKETDKKAEALKKTTAQKDRAAQEDRQQELQRQENIKRMAGLANAGTTATTANGPSSSNGAAAQSSGPSASYGGRIRARIKPNIVFTEDVAGNPQAIVEVRTSPDGSIVGRKLIKTSGSPAWDEAVLKAIDKTDILPKDTDGRVPPTLEITFRPKD